MSQLNPATSLRIQIVIDIEVIFHQNITKLCHHKIFLLYGFISRVGRDRSFRYTVNLVKRYLGLHVSSENAGKTVFPKKSSLDTSDRSN